MSERKVLNKYYPPDFDPSKIPRMKLPKNRQYTVRLMAPFNMRCVTCGEYIYKGKKFNARKEDVEGQDYLGIRIYRFYIKCTRCLQEISFKTDPKNTDYEIEAGATRNFMALKLAEEQAQREEDERREDEATNPMKLLENRTKQSKQELELLESLEELRDLNRRQRTVDYDSMLSQYDDKDLLKRLEEQQEAEDERFIRSVFGSKKRVVEEIIEDDSLTTGLSEVRTAAKKRAVPDLVKAIVVSTERGPETETVEPSVSRASETASSSSISNHTADLSGPPSIPAKSSAPVPRGLSMGLVNSKKTGLASLAGLVRVKRPAETGVGAGSAAPSAPPALASPSAPPAPSAPSAPSAPCTGLALLGSYSDSDSSDGT